MYASLFHRSQEPLPNSRIMSRTLAHCSDASSLMFKPRHLEAVFIAESKLRTKTNFSEAARVQSQLGNQHINFEVARVTKAQSQTTPPVLVNRSWCAHKPRACRKAAAQTTLKASGGKRTQRTRYPKYFPSLPPLC